MTTETQTRTLEQHFADIKARADRRELGPLPNLNAFAKEMTRAKEWKSLPNLEEQPSTEYHFKREYEVGFPKEDYELYCEAQLAGFRSQRLAGLENRIIAISIWPGGLISLNTQAFSSREVPTSDYEDFKKGINRDWLLSRDEKWDVTVLPHFNHNFPVTFTLRGDEKVVGMLREPGSISSEIDVSFRRGEDYDTRDLPVYGFTEFDLCEGATENILSDFKSVARLAHVIGRKITKVPSEERRKREEIRAIFGIQPPTEEQIAKGLAQVHKYNGRFSISWVEAAQLRYPLTKGVLCLYRDAKESGLFENLEFGVLREIKDPVLAGTYKGIRIPLAYWA